MSFEEFNLSFYRHVVIRYSTEKPTRQELIAIERALGVKLPRQFISFLRVGNGGTTDYSVKVPPLPNGEPIGFNDIYCTRRKDKRGRIRETFIEAYEQLHENPTIPREVLPIARDGMGSEFYLDLSKEGHGRVVIFRHGAPAWTGFAQDDELFELASSFDEFVDLLYIEEDIARLLIQDAVKSGKDSEIEKVKMILEHGYPNWRSLINRKTE